MCLAFAAERRVVRRTDYREAMPAPNSIPYDIEVLLTDLMEFDPVRGCRVDDDRGDPIVVVGVVDPPGCAVMTRPLSFGGTLSVWFAPRPAIGVVSTLARKIYNRLSNLVLANERDLVRPPRKPGAA